MTAGKLEDLAGRLRAEPLVQKFATALEAAGIEAWIVGGAVRDAALGIGSSDYDLAVAGDPAAAAKVISDALDAHRFELSAGFGTWRIVDRTREWQVDVTALRADGGVEADLRERDFTIGAMAVSLRGGELIDPYDGLKDLAAGYLRVVSAHSFSADPLRLLRAARIAAEHELKIEDATVTLAKQEADRADEPAAERLLEEIRQLVGGRDPERGLQLAHELGVLRPVLPELEALRGVDQGPNHHLDVYDHTIEVLRGVLDLESRTECYVGERADEVRSHLAMPLADGFTRGEALRMGALFHDIGKPASRIEHEGMIGFPGHDESGAEIIGKLADRLHFSRRLRRHLREMARHHLRLGFLVHRMPLSRREIYAYLDATGDVAIDVTLLTIADRLAARGTSGLASDEMVNGHLNLAKQMVTAGLDLRRQGRPKPLLRGDELAAELGIEPGPELAELVRELEIAQYAGEVEDREQAVAHMRDFVAR